MTSIQTSENEKAGKWARWWIAGVSLVCVGVGLYSVGCPEVGWQTLLFFVVGGLLPLALFASEIMISKDGTLHLKGLSFFANKALMEDNVGRKGKSPDSEDADDPQKGRWGGSDFSNDFRLTATVTPIPGTPDLFAVRLVTGGPAARAGGAAKAHFHLHPTFKKTPDPSVEFRSGKAVLELVAWGAFTVGVQILDGSDEVRATLELDLATLPDAPDVFVSR